MNDKESRQPSFGEADDHNSKHWNVETRKSTWKLYLWRDFWRWQHSYLIGKRDSCELDIVSTEGTLTVMLIKLSDWQEYQRMLQWRVNQKISRREECRLKFHKLIQDGGDTVSFSDIKSCFEEFLEDYETPLADIQDEYAKLLADLSHEIGSNTSLRLELKRRLEKQATAITT